MLPGSAGQLNLSLRFLGVVNKLPAKMTSMVEHQRAKGCFLEKGSEPGEYDHKKDDNRVGDDDGDPDDDDDEDVDGNGNNDDDNTVGKVVPDRQAAESGVSQVEVGIHLQLGHLQS